MFLERTTFDLLVEFYEDFYQKNPLEAHRNEDGQVQFQDTGDELLDKWESQLAEGRTPDYMEAFDSEQLERLKKLREKGSSKFAGLTKSMKDVVESVDQAARNDGLQPTQTPQPRFSTFGDGSE